VEKLPLHRAADSPSNNTGPFCGQPDGNRAGRLPAIGVENMTNTFAHLARAAALTAVLAAGPAMASNKVDDATKEKVTAQLTAQGYEVRKIQMENGLIEAYAVKDGKTLEVYLDADLKVVKTIAAD
jgi:hypothetical protein